MALNFPRSLFMELFINGSWNELITRVRQRDLITISGGRGGEQGEVVPRTLECTFDNEDGYLTPGNANSPWYRIVGRGIPIRFGLISASDSFTRSVSSGWGNTTTGEAWSSAGAGGSVLASDWNVNGSAGTHSVPVVSGYRYSTLDTVIYQDVEVAATVTVAINNITGGPIEPCNLMVRRNAGTYYMTRISINSAEDLSISIHHSTGGQLTTPVTVSGLVDSVSSKVIRVRMQVEGRTIRAKVYTPGFEPMGWDVEHNDNTSTMITNAGAIGIRNGVASTNTNALPIVFSVDDVEVRNLRFAGEIAELKPRWNTNHSDKYAELVASTVLRRLKQGKTPLKSALRRAYLADDIDFPIQYWPCEEGKDAQQLRSAIDNRHMSISGTRPHMAQFTELLCSSPLPRFNGSVWTGHVAPYASTGEAQARFVLAVPKDGLADNTAVADIRFNGNLNTFRILYRSGGGLSVTIYNSIGAIVYTGGSIALNIDGTVSRVSLELTQNGANVDWGLSRYEVVGGVTGALGGASGSQAGNFNIPEIIIMNPEGTLTDTACGHIVIQSEITSGSELAIEFNAHRSDTPLFRTERLCRENGIAPLARFGATLTPFRMGPQLPTTLYSLLQQCQDTAQGTLYDSRYSGNTIIFRSLNTVYAQSIKLTLDYAANQITPPLQPASDDRPIKNDITAQRLEGGEYRTSRETGPVNAQEPGTDNNAVGRFDQQVPVNPQFETQLPNIASWALNLGTVEEERFPKVSLNLAAAEVEALQDEILDLTLDDRFVIINMQEADYNDGLDLIVRGYKEVFDTARRHTIDFNCAPYEPYRVGVYNDSTSRWSSDGTVLDAALTSTGTSFVVDVNTGQPWTTVASNFPMDVMIGGEQIRISAISAPGSSLPPTTQTFTVAGSGRSINGVVKDHSAGDPVRIARTYYGR